MLEHDNVLARVPCPSISFSIIGVSEWLLECCPPRTRFIGLLGRSVCIGLSGWRCVQLAVHAQLAGLSELRATYEEKAAAAGHSERVAARATARTAVMSAFNKRRVIGAITTDGSL